ncbi:vignain-like [Miscanthus floridulus]|uniref:vignain-like n=1 Tax=Miscanthus floridulus TaxID=154761 RepID=UPI0034577C6E
MMKQQLAKLVGVVALLALMALLEPAATADVKFTIDDLNFEASLWGLYQRWGARYNVERAPVEKLRRFNTFKETAHHVASHARVVGHAPGLNAFADLSSLESQARAYSRPSYGGIGGQAAGSSPPLVAWDSAQAPPLPSLRGTPHELLASLRCVVMAGG